MPLILAVLIVALAAHRLARGVAVDSITDRPRDWLYAKAYTQPVAQPFPPGARDEHDAELEGWEPPPPARVKSRAWSWLYGLTSCPHCCGWWLSLGLWIAWTNWDDSHAVIAAVAVAGAQSVISAKGME